MENCLIIIVAIIVIIYLLSYSKIYITLQCKRDESNDYIAVDVYIFRRLLAYSMEVPMVEIGDIKDSLWLKSKIKTDQSQDETHIKREQRFVKKTVEFYMLHPRKLGRVIRQVRYYARLYYNVMNKFNQSLHCEQLQWKTIYGSEDAEQTGIVTGMLWSVKALIIARLKKHVIVINKPIINVNPIFGQNTVKVDFQCIFSMGLGNVINAMRILYNIKR